MVNFQQLKIQLIDITGLERDALHIYVGIAVFLISLLLTRPMLKSYIWRLNIALIMATLFALLGEYLDLSVHYELTSADNLLAISKPHLKASIHDIINTCFWPYILYAVNRWTNIFNKNG